MKQEKLFKMILISLLALSSVLAQVELSIIPDHFHYDINDTINVTVYAENMSKDPFDVWFPSGCQTSYYIGGYNAQWYTTCTAAFSNLVINYGTPLHGSIPGTMRRSHLNQVSIPWQPIFWTNIFSYLPPK